MTTFVPYIPSSTKFENLDLTGNDRRRFYTVKGTSSNPEIKLISPSQQIVERAKMDLEREAGINISQRKRKRPQSSGKSKSRKKGGVNKTSKKKTNKRKYSKR